MRDRNFSAYASLFYVLDYTYEYHQIVIQHIHSDSGNLVCPCRCHIAFGEQTLPVYSDIDCRAVGFGRPRGMLRLSFFTSFAYFAFLHIFGADKRVSSGHVLVSILTSLTVIGGIKLLTAESYANETVFIIVFGLTATMVFLATRPKVRRYFGIADWPECGRTILHCR